MNPRIGHAWWLRLTIPLTLMGMVAAAIGAFVDGAYGGMSEDWARQTRAQDLADLFLGFPALLATAAWAMRGSTRALLAWLGVLAAILYTYVIFAFAVPFGPMYLVNVALLGLAGWSFAGAIRALDVPGIAARVEPGAPLRTAGWAIVVVAVLFLAAWLAEDLPAMLGGDAPESLQDVGLIVNPVHVLDTAFLLPAAIVFGIATLRRRPSGIVAAPVLLVAFATISAGIVAIMLLTAADGDRSVLPIAGAMTILGVLQASLAWWILRRIGRAD